MKLKRKPYGPVIEIIIMAIVISVLCLILHLIGFSGYKTEAGTFETTLMVINNIFSKEGIKYLLNNTLAHFQTLEPLVLIIVSLIAVSIMEAR